MPPSWPTRLLSGSSTPSSNNSPSPASRSSSNRYLPGPCQPLPIHPVIQQSPDSPTRAAAPRQHAHNRSSSHPLPRMFSRKKSSGALRQNVDADPPLDESLVPVLDDDRFAVSPNKAIVGRKRQDEGPNAVSQCMCCNSKVRFPRDLKVFRCTSCLTINDLEPMGTAASKDDKCGNADQERAFRYTRFDASKPILPLSIERTRAIIDQCLRTYFEVRCQKEAFASERGQSRSSSPNRPMVRKGSVQGTVETSLAPRPKLQHETPLSGRKPSLDAATPRESTTASTRSAADLNHIGSTVGTSLKAAPPLPHPQANGGPSISRNVPLRKPVPTQPARKPGPLPLGIASSPPRPSMNRHVTPEDAVSRPHLPPPDLSFTAEQDRYERAKKIFRPLEDYALDNFGRFECLNISFSNARPRPAGRTHSESAIRTPPPEMHDGTWAIPESIMSEIDAKTLLLGDFAENGDWWTGRMERNHSERSDRRMDKPSAKRGLVTSRSPCIEWEKAALWYEIVHNAGQRWWDRLDQMDLNKLQTPDMFLKGARNGQDIEADMLIARKHAERALLKLSENLLKRPGRPLTKPEDIRFLLLILSNPSLYPQYARKKDRADSTRPWLDAPPVSPKRAASVKAPMLMPRSPTKPRESSVGQHNGILKRAFGLLANSSDQCHRYLIGWFCRMPRRQFVDLVDLVASFVTHRLSRPRTRSKSGNGMTDGGLIPDLSGSAAATSAQLQAATGLGGATKKRGDSVQTVVDYSEDWQLQAAAKVMALLFAANNTWQNKGPSDLSDDSALALSRPRAKMHGQLLPTSDFYNTLLDYHDLIADFKAWESKKAKFAFCQYPFFLSMGSKIKVLEYDARRQMENKAREAYFDNVISSRNMNVNFHLTVRRDCMVDDSLRQIGEAVGAGQEDLKKGLRVHFVGEEGVDAGGPRKEWFLMLVREIFDPNHGMFLYDDESNTCYFNPNSFETSDQFYLVGALLGLAIYNSTILDVALPPFAFRKLLSSAPNTSSASAPNPNRGAMQYTIDDLAEYRPALAAGLRQLLEFDGNVETVFCRDFVAPVERYGTVVEIPLCSGGEKKPVTNANRQEFVDLYIRYLLDTSVARQFEPFKRGFFTVCAGNALSLFRPEEIELLVRGSEEALDVDSLRGVAVYENWKIPATPPPSSSTSTSTSTTTTSTTSPSNAKTATTQSQQQQYTLLSDPAEQVPSIRWFWEYFSSADPTEQRSILSFITGSDRIPAVGSTNLVLRIVAGGDGTGREEENEIQQNRKKMSTGTGAGTGTGGVGGLDRFPIARTCFNMLILWRYESKEKLVEKLSRAVKESEGFGLK